jgi:hypothetical protein
MHSIKIKASFFLNKNIFKDFWLNEYYNKYCGKSKHSSPIASYKDLRVEATHTALPACLTSNESESEESFNEDILSPAENNRLSKLIELRNQTNKNKVRFLNSLDRNKLLKNFVTKSNSITADLFKSTKNSLRNASASYLNDINGQKLAKNTSNHQKVKSEPETNKTEKPLQKKETSHISKKDWNTRTYSSTRSYNINRLFSRRKTRSTSPDSTFNKQGDNIILFLISNL